MDIFLLKNVCLSVVCLLSVCLSRVRPQVSFEPLVQLGQIFFTKTRENVYLRILILKFRGQQPRVKALGKILAPNQLWATIFVQSSQKVYFFKDKFILQGVILAEFWFFALEGTQGLNRPPQNQF